MTFNEIWSIVGPHSQLGETRSRYLHGLLRTCPTGYMAEVGTYKGYTSLLMLLTCPWKRLCVFDTFSGIARSDPAIDKHRDGEFAQDMQSVKALLDTANSKGGFVLYGGEFPGTFHGCCFDFAFVHSDTDTYFGTKATLEAFWPHMEPGGILLFDDYLFDPCPGIAKALHEWSAQTGIEIMVASSGGQAWVVKP